MRRWKLIALVIVCLSLAGCFERIVEPADVFGNIKQGETYSPASNMIDDWYAVEAITHKLVILETQRQYCPYSKRVSWALLSS